MEPILANMELVPTLKFRTVVGKTSTVYLIKMVFINFVQNINVMTPFVKRVKYKCLIFRIIESNLTKCNSNYFTDLLKYDFADAICIIKSWYLPGNFKKDS